MSSWYEGETVDCEGQLLLKTKKMMFFSGTSPKWCVVKDCTMALCEDKLTKPDADAIYNLSGCSLSAVEKPIGFTIKPVGASQPMVFQCDSEDEQTKWMSALFEAKLTKGKGDTDPSSCTLQ